MRKLHVLALVLGALFVALSAGCAIPEETAEVAPTTTSPVTIAPVATASVATA